MHINDLTPGTAYLFRVQALGSDGSPGGSSMEEQFETSSEGTEVNHHEGSFMSFVQEWDFSDVHLSFLYFSRTPYSKQHGSHLRRSSWRRGHVVHSGRGPVPTQTVSNHPPLLLSQSFCPVNQSECTLLHWLPLSFFCLSFVGPPNGLCIHSLLTSLFLSSFSQLSLSLYLDLCPSTHWGRICVECALSLLNGYIPVSVEAFERKLVRGGTLLVIRGA